MKYAYIPTGIGEFIGSGEIAIRSGKLSELLKEKQWLFILVDKLFLVFTYIQAVSLDAGEKVGGVIGEANGNGR